MSAGFLLTRVLLKFEDLKEDMIADLSAATMTPDGSLWLGSDELLGVERLLPQESCVYGDHQHFSLTDIFEFPDSDDEIDIEGLDYSDGYLWVIGSHSTKRKKPKQKSPEDDIERLTIIESELNRYLLGRVPVFNGGIVKKYAGSADRPEEQLFAAKLEIDDQHNALIAALQDDPHIGEFVSTRLPSKDNGLDIEGIAVKGNRIFLGLRGPVIRGIGIILELVVTANASGVLELKPLDSSGKLYYKHLVDLDGSGIRELCFDGDDLIILSGPTMDLDGFQELFRYKNILSRQSDSITWQDSDDLESVFELPLKIKEDKAEGLLMFPCLGQSEAAMVIYDSPSPKRKLSEKTVLADVFSLSQSS
ncbi:MAG: DUF3616 domain-containing protein [Microcoleaceae cyanobacterium]